MAPLSSAETIRAALAPHAATLPGIARCSIRHGPGHGAPEAIALGEKLAPVFLFPGGAFGVSRSLMERHVWEAVRKHLQNTRMQDLYGGFVYIISGEAP
jgi:hypothetical protein